MARLRSPTPLAAVAGAAAAITAMQALAQAPARPKTDIDGYSGILFYCKPVASEAWTQRWCEQMGTEMTGWATRSAKPIALLRTTDGREQNVERARAAGFDARNALWVLLTLDPRRSSPSGWDLNARADGIATGQTLTSTYTKSEILAAGVQPAEATDRGKRILGSIMTALTVPMRPL